jgi:hypothetical protein
MNEANAELLDSDLLRDAEATNQRPALVERPTEEGAELTTMTRLPPITPPPPMTTTMVPPALPASFRPPAPSPAPQVALEAVALHFPHEPAASAKPSWLKALLTPTVPPAATGQTATLPMIRPTTAGAVLASLGLVFALLALVTGLRGTPDTSVAPVVAAAIVLARALVTLGAGALSFLLFRSAERLLVSPDQAR